MELSPKNKEKERLLGKLAELQSQAKFWEIKKIIKIRKKLNKIIKGL